MNISRTLKLFVGILTVVVIFFSCSSDDSYVTPRSTNSGGGNSSSYYEEDNEYTVSNNGASAYIFNGGNFSDSANPNLTLKRGETYTFTITSSGHPFLIKNALTTGTGDQYNDGVSNNGTDSGTITFDVPDSAPDTLYYICEFHASMQGVITISD